ncbi:MAG: hypothetical protein QOD86_2889 [Miltoncostaeaceae bacterium]|jgi:mannose-6-phosphate isomerase-like protein (cupin superfamily)|nr:hypothetical protein [Miltoncostaeaceae bacterium]
MGAGHTRLNLREDVEDMAPRFGLSPGLESRFAREALGLEKSGITYYRIGPGFRIPFGHTHREQEEVYLLVSGSARLALDDEVVDLRPWDAVRIPAPTMRTVQGGPEGAELVAFGAPRTEEMDAEMTPGWWPE